MKRYTGAILAVLLVVSGYAAGCAGSPGDVDKRAVSRVVGEVMSAQVRIGSAEKMAALGELEQFLTATELRSPGVARALHQLADLYLTIELNTYEKALVRYRQSGGTGEPPTARHDRSIGLYIKLLKEYPDRAENEAVYYQLAHIYDNLGDTVNTARMLEAMLKLAPHGGRTVEARYRLAELAFDRSAYREAARRYEALLSPKLDARVRDFVLYKRVWALYLSGNLRAVGPGALAFLDDKRSKVGNAWRLTAQTMPEPDWERVREVVILLARAARELDGADTLARLFAERRDYEHMVYRKLGELEGDAGDTFGAVAAYQAFIKRRPDAPQAPLFMGYMIDQYAQAGDQKTAIDLRVKMVERYRPGGEWWNKQSAATHRSVGAVVRETTHGLARHYHAEAQERKHPAAYRRAIDWYSRFLNRFPDSQEAPRAAFLLGEALFEQGEFAEAADAYAKAAFDAPPHKQAAEAAYAAVYATEQALSRLKEGSKPYGKTLGQLVERFMALVKKFPDEKRIPAAFKRITSLLFAAGDHARLYDLSDHMIRYGPRLRSLHVLAWRALGEAALETGRLERAETALEQSLSYVKNDPEQEAELKKLLAAAVISRVNEGGLSDADAILAMDKAASLVDPDDPLAQTVRLDAAAARARSGDRTGALVAYGAFLKAFPDSVYADRVSRAVLVIGESALEGGDTGAARMAWQRHREWFSGRWPERDRSVARLEARSYLDDGDLERADRAYSHILDSYAGGHSPEEVPEEIVDQLAGIRYKRAAALLEAGDRKGLDILQSIADELPGSRIAPTALDAVIGEALRHDPGRAVDAAGRLLARYPESDQAAAVRGRYPELLLAAGDPVGAARFLMRQAEEEEDAARAEAIIRRAAGLFEQGNDTEEALAAWHALRSRYRAGSDAWVRAEIAAIHLQQSGTAILPEDLKVEDLAPAVADRLLDVLTPLNESDMLEPMGRLVAARIWLARAEDSRADFDAVRLVPPLKENLARKKDALKLAMGHFAEASAFRSLAVTPNATRQIGEMLEAFADALLASPTPKELTGAQVNIYREALEKRARPYIKKAIKTHESNLNRARDGVITDDVRASLAALARLNPGQYARPEIKAKPIDVP